MDGCRKRLVLEVQLEVITMLAGSTVLGKASAPAALFRIVVCVVIGVAATNPFILIVV
jgi:predicted GTPase